MFAHPVERTELVTHNPGFYCVQSMGERYLMRVICSFSQAPKAFVFHSNFRVKTEKYMASHLHTAQSKM